MNKIITDRNAPPIRLFKSDFLEFFSHIHPLVVLSIWLPTALLLLVVGIIDLPYWYSPLVIPGAFLIGVFLWSITEYLLHRFVFHFHPKGKKLERIVFLFHGMHHAQPLCKTRLVMPPVVSIPLAFLYYGLFALIVGLLFDAWPWIAPLFSGLISGYLFYDISHYATHHFTIRGGYFNYIKLYHMKHHFKTPTQRFGVSSPVWDKVFGTMPAD